MDSNSNSPHGESGPAQPFLIKARLLGDSVAPPEPRQAPPAPGSDPILPPPEGREALAVFLGVGVFLFALAVFGAAALVQALSPAPVRPPLAAERPALFAPGPGRPHLLADPDFLRSGSGLHASDPDFLRSASGLHAADPDALVRRRLPASQDALRQGSGLRFSASTVSPNHFQTFQKPAP